VCYPNQPFPHFELPPGGFCGSLWESKQKSNQLHRYFIQHRSDFVHPDPTVCYDIAPEMRFSINFFAILPSAIHYYTWVLMTGDDEAMLTVGITSRFQFHKCMYPRMTVSHLAFFSQADPQNDPKLLYRYALLLNESIPELALLVQSKITQLQLTE
jgi:hypothetical protein